MNELLLHYEKLLNKLAKEFYPEIMKDWKVVLVDRGKEK